MKAKEQPSNKKKIREKKENLTRGRFSRARLPWQNVNFYEDIKFTKRKRTRRMKKMKDSSFDGNKNVSVS
jgi:hypothetical protein